MRLKISEKKTFLSHTRKKNILNRMSEYSLNVGDYSETKKTMKYEEDFKTPVVILNSQMNI